MLCGLEDLLEIVVVEVTAEGVRVGTYSESWRLRTSDYRSCDAETAGAEIKCGHVGQIQ